jgi:hypothetical protein
VSTLVFRESTIYLQSATRERGVVSLVSGDGKRYDLEYRVQVEKGETYWNEYWVNGKLYGRSR